MKFNNTVELLCTISPDGAVTIQTQDGSEGYAWGPGTEMATEIVKCLEDIEMISTTE